jgi:hypothetical protein
VLCDTSFSAPGAGSDSLLTDDVFKTMPPLPREYRGVRAVAEFVARVFASGVV